MTHISNINSYPDNGITNEPLLPAGYVLPVNTTPSDAVAFSGRTPIAQQSWVEAAQNSWSKAISGLKRLPVKPAQQQASKSSFPTWLKASLGVVGACTLSILAATGLHHLKVFDLDKSKWTKWLNIARWFKKASSKPVTTSTLSAGSDLKANFEDWSAQETEPSKFQSKWSDLEKFKDTPEIHWTKKVFLWNWSHKETDSVQLQRIWSELGKLPKDTLMLNETKIFVLAKCSDIEKDPEQFQSIWSAGNLSEETPTLINGAKCDFLKKWSTKEKKSEQFQFIWNELEKLPVDTSNLNENKRSVLYYWAEKETDPAKFPSIWSGLEKLPSDHAYLNSTKAYVLEEWANKETDRVKLQSLWAKLEALPEDTLGLIGVKAAVRLKHPNINGE